MKSKKLFISAGPPLTESMWLPHAKSNSPHDGSNKIFSLCLIRQSVNETRRSLSLITVLPLIFPENFSKNDIHKYLDAGFDENTTIELDDGRSILIKDIEVNDGGLRLENVTITSHGKITIGHTSVWEASTIIHNSSNTKALTQSKWWI